MSATELTKSEVEMLDLLKAWRRGPGKGKGADACPSVGKMAEYCGVTRIHAGRMLAALRKKGIVPAYQHEDAPPAAPIREKALAFAQDFLRREGRAPTRDLLASGAGIAKNSAGVLLSRFRRDGLVPAAGNKAGRSEESEGALIAPPPRVRGNPLDLAEVTLIGRVSRMPGGFRLDGRPASNQQVVAEANRVLRGRGEPPISYPGVLEIAA